jgi:hypothetical protein
MQHNTRDRRRGPPSRRLSTTVPPHAGKRRHPGNAANEHRVRLKSLRGWPFRTCPFSANAVERAMDDGN